MARTKHADPKKNRRLFPTKTVMALFWIYLLSAFGVLVLLFEMNELSRQSLNTANRLQAVNIGAMIGLGFILFFLVKLYFDVKFTQFMTRMDRELRIMMEYGPHSIRFRKSRLNPWFLRELNSMIESLYQPYISLQETIGTLKGVLTRKVNEKDVRTKEIKQICREFYVEEPPAGESASHRQAGQLPAQWERRMRSAALWAGLYSFVFLVLWLAVPTWQAADSGEHPAANLWMKIGLGAGFFGYIAVIVLLSYFWIQLQKQQLLHAINEACRENEIGGKPCLLKLQRSTRIGFFASTFNMYLLSSLDHAHENLERFLKIQAMIKKLPAKTSQKKLQTLRTMLEDL